MLRGMVSFSISSVLTVTMVVAASPHAMAVAPTKVFGSSCSKEGAQISAKAKGKNTKAKQSLVCVKTVDGLRWGDALVLPSKPAAARTLLGNWAATPEPAAFSDIRTTLEVPKEQLAQELAAAAQLRDEWSAKFAEVQSRIAALQAEQQGIPNQLAAATRATEDAKKTYDGLNETAKREISTLNGLSGEYSAAQSALWGGLGPGVACSFGSTQYCAQAQAYAAQRPWANAVVARYNAQKARTDAAVAAASTAYRNWEAKFAEYKRLSDRQALIPGELGSASTDLNHARGMESNAVANANLLNERLQLFDQLNLSLQEFAALNNQKLALIDGVAIGQPGWQRRLSVVSRVQEGLEVSERSILDLWTRYAT